MHRGKTILIVDDDALVAIGERRSLERRGYRVVTAVSGVEALSALDESIDLILMDVDLGDDPDGTETAAEILKIRDLPIVFVSSHAEREIVERTEAVTSYGYVVKGSNVTALDTAIKMAFRLFEARREDARKAAALAEALERYRLLFDDSGVGIGYYDPDGVVISYNRIAALNMGGVPEDYVGKSILELFPGEPGRIYQERIRESAASALPRTYSNLIPAPTGTKFFSSTYHRICGADGKVLGVQITSQDLTERWRAEESLRARQSRERAIIETAMDGMWLVAGDGRIVDVNQAYCAMSGYSRDELLSMSLFDLVPSEEPAGMRRRMERIASQGSERLVSVHKRKDGSVYDIEISVGYIPNEEGLYVCFGRDVTEWKKSQARIEDLLAEKELILRETHHRLKNNMNTVRSLLFLQAGQLEDAAAAKALEDAAGRVEGMAFLYDTLFRTPDTTSLPLAEFVPGLAERVLADLLANGGVALELEIDPVTLEAGKAQPFALLLNELLSNIAKYAFAGRENGRVTVRVRDEGEAISLEVGDDGVGLPESLDPENSPGFGLQLASALAAQLKGSMKVERDGGMRISLRFER